MNGSRRLAGRAALVTGAGRGLGRGIAEALAAEGAEVIAGDVTPPDPAFPDEGRIRHVELDVTDRASVRRAVSGIVERHGRLDLLVNNAGVAPPAARLEELEDELIDRTIAVNLRGTITCCQEAIKVFRSQRGAARIVNVASYYGMRPFPDWAVYSATKAAVVGLTRALALELAEAGVVVNAVCPGTFDSDMSRTAFARAAGTGVERAGELLDRYAEEKIPLGRIGSAADVGRAVAWLASDECSFTTGAALNLTGGEDTAF